MDLDDLHGSLLVNAKLVLQLTFKCVFRDDLHGSRPSFFVKKKFETTYMDDFRVSRLTDDFYVTCLEKNKFLCFIFQLQN